MIAARQMAFGRSSRKKEEPPAYWGLCFTAEEDGATIGMGAVGSAPAVTLETSYDGAAWEPFYVGETSIALKKGERVYFRAGDGGNVCIARSITSYNRFLITSGRVSASGNISSLLNGDSPDSAISHSCYANLFLDCTSLTHSPELPATTLNPYCYYYMFGGCTSLTHAPELPATSLTAYCYRSMFADCTSLTHAPELPAEKLVAYCYANMFQGCKSLERAPKLPSATTNRGCYQYMFDNCQNLNFIECSANSFTASFNNWVRGVSPIGTFVCSTALGTNDTIERGISRCPEGWTVINKD